jgi:hypothetical protein
VSYCMSFHDVVSSQEFDTCEYPVVDAHVHFVDFLQESQGLRALLRAMDEAGVEAAVIFGLPVVKKWAQWEPERPHYYLDDNARCYSFTATDGKLAAQLRSLDKASRSHFLPLLCGFNPTDRNSVYVVEDKLDGSRIWRGIGEIFCRHDDLTNLIMEETSRMDHPALMAIYDLAGQRGLPVLLHQNSSSVGRHDRFEYLHEVRNALSAFPGTDFVWAHCGISRRVGGKLYHRMIREMLNEYDNLFVDISWVVYDQTVCRRKEPKESWVKLVIDFPDRFMLGSDLCGHFRMLGKTMSRYNRLLHLLPEDARNALCRENALRIYGD